MLLFMVLAQGYSGVGARYLHPPPKDFWIRMKTEERRNIPNINTNN
jgi:hypothetical protein